MNEEKDVSANQKVEETVADLKKKIQQLSEEKEAKETTASGLKTITEFKLDDQKIEEIKQDTAETLNRTISSAKEKANDVFSNADLQKTLNFLKNNASKAVDSARSSIDEFSSSPQARSALDNAAGAVEQLKQKASGLMNDETREYLKNASEALKQSASDAGQKVQEYMARPDVQNKLAEVKEKAGEIVKKGSETLKDVFKDPHGQE